MIAILAAVFVVALTTAVGPALAQTVYLGETGTFGALDSGNAGLLLSQGPYNLSQPATIQSLSFYVVSAKQQLRLGIYTSGAGNDCKGGTLKAETDAFIPTSNTWNTANVTSQVLLPAGNYCLAWEPRNNNLSSRKGVVSGQSSTYYTKSFGSMPATFSSSPNTDPNHRMFYATLSGQTLTLTLTFNPPNPSLPEDAPLGTIVTQAIPAWSDGSPFIGTLAFAAPNFSDGGVFALDANFNVILSTSGSGLTGDANTVQNATVNATQ